MSGNTESVTGSVGGSGQGNGGTAGMAGPEATPEMTEIRTNDSHGTGVATPAIGVADVPVAGVVPEAGEARHARPRAGAGGGARTPGGRGGGAGSRGTAPRDGEAPPAAIGPRLARAREAAGLSVAELSRITRIREPVIHAIEHDDFSMSGGDFYARGHIRNIARAVGIDPEPLVQEYDDQHGGVPMPVRAAEVFLAEIPIKLRERRSFNWTTALAFALILVVGFGVARMLSGSGGVDSADLRRPTAQSGAVSPAAAPSAAPSRQPAAPATAAPARDEVVVQVTADRTTRLVVRDAKGRRLFRGDFLAGSTSEWRARGKIDVTATDAGAVRLKVNGKDLGPAGPAGQRVTRSFGPKPAR